MKRKKRLLLYSAFLGIILLFFYRVIFFQQIPFPGDLLVNDQPYKTQSYLGYAPGGYPNKAQDRDVMYGQYPWKYFSINQLKKGDLPMWNPHNFSGNLQLQNFQTAIFYPLNIFFFLFPFNTGWSILIISQPILAMIFMYLFMREYSLHPLACIAAAIAFAFSSYMIVWLEYGNIASTFLWLPLLLLFIKRLIETQKISNFIYGVCAFTIAILAGYIQGIFYIYTVCFLYGIYLIRRSGKRTDFRLRVLFLSLFILPIFLSASQLLPTIQLFLTSTRSNYTTTQIHELLQPIYYIVTLFSSDFFGNPAARNYFLPITYIERVMYVGIPVLFFTFYSFYSRQKDKIFFSIAAIVVLLITVNLPGIAYIYKIPFPLISTTVPTRALSIFIFCFIVLSAFGMDYWLKTKAKKHLIPIIFLSCYAVLWLGVMILPNFLLLLALHKGIIIHNLLFSTILACASVILFYAEKKWHRVVSVLLIILILFDCYYFFNKITPFSPPALIYPKTPVITYLQHNAGINRFWGYGEAYIPPNFQSVDGTYSPEGVDALHLRNYGLLLASTLNGQQLNVQLLPRPDANIAPGFGESDLKNNTARQKILNLLGVKYLLHISSTPDIPSSVFPEKIYRLIWHEGPWQIYENMQALPRFFLASDYVVSKDNKDTLKLIYSSDLAKTLILNTKPTIPPSSSFQGSSKLLSYNPTNVQIQTYADKPVFLFLSDNYYSAWNGSSWNAFIDGKQTPLYQADLTFRAVEIPKGDHKVTFIYGAKGFRLGLYFAFVGLLYFISLSIISLKRESDKSE